MDKQYGVVSVRFINKGNKLSSKEYSYNVDEKLYKKLASISFTYYDIIMNYKYYNKFLIVNENGYNYNKVLIEELDILIKTWFSFLLICMMDKQV